MRDERQRDDRCDLSLGRAASGHFGRTVNAEKGRSEYVLLLSNEADALEPGCLVRGQCGVRAKFDRRRSLVAILAGLSPLVVPALGADLTTALMIVAL